MDKYFDFNLIFSTNKRRCRRRLIVYGTHAYGEWKCEKKTEKKDGMMEWYTKIRIQCGNEIIV